MITALVRIGLAAVWLVAGVLKLLDPGGAATTVRAYDVLPEPVVDPVALGLPLLEVLIGLLLLAGFAVRPAAVASAALLVVFIAGLAQAWARGLAIDCGCFGGGGAVAPGETTYPLDLARDALFLAAAVFLIVRPGGRWSVDTWIRQEGVRA